MSPSTHANHRRGQRVVRQAANRSRPVIESLESRVLMSLLGPGGISQPLGQPQMLLPLGETSYNAKTDVLQAQGIPILFTASGHSFNFVTPSPFPMLGISIDVNSSGQLVGSPSSTNLVVNGKIKVGNTTYNSQLLTGSIFSFGESVSSRGQGEMDFLFKPTGGSLDPTYFNNFTYIGVDLDFSVPKNTNPFSKGFSDLFVGALGSVPSPVVTPTLTTQPGPTVVIGSGQKLTDSDTLSGGNQPGGSITFTLLGPNGASTVDDTETVTVAGNGTYSTPKGYLPAGPGTYQWVCQL